MPLLPQIPQPVGCPDLSREKGKPCTHYRERLCALPDHPLCEEWARRNPDREGPRKLAAVRPGSAYRDLVRDGQWFARNAPIWREEGAALDRACDPEGAAYSGDEGALAQWTVYRDAAAKRAALLPSPGPGGIVMVGPEKFEMPKKSKLSLAAFHRYPLRKCRTLHHCSVCSGDIKDGQHYYDGGHGRRAHQECAPAVSSEVSTSRVPTEEEVFDLEARGIVMEVESPELGNLWLVPAYTPADRKEMSWRHFRTAMVLLAFFPGSTVSRVQNPRGAPEPAPGPFLARCSCHEQALDSDCPLGRAVGVHAVGDHAELFCSCQDGKDLEGCPAGRAYGTHVPASPARGGE